MDCRIKSLCKRAKRADKNAACELLEIYYSDIFAYLRRLCCSNHDAEDLTQQTFLKAWSSLDGFSGRSKFTTWLYKIAFNHSIDAIRKKKLKTLPLDRPILLREGEVRHEIRDETQSPEGDFIFSEKKELIQKTIDALPERYRMAIILRHQEERSYEEISQILKIPLGTVKARIFRAREMLKKKLREE